MRHPKHASPSRCRTFGFWSSGAMKPGMPIPSRASLAFVFLTFEKTAKKHTRRVVTVEKKQALGKWPTSGRPAGRPVADQWPTSEPKSSTDRPVPEQGSKTDGVADGVTESVLVTESRETEGFETG